MMYTNFNYPHCEIIKILRGSIFMYYKAHSLSYIKVNPRNYSNEPLKKLQNMENCPKHSTVLLVKNCRGKNCKAIWNPDLYMCKICQVWMVIICYRRYIKDRRGLAPGPGHSQHYFKIFPNQVKTGGGWLLSPRVRVWWEITAIGA